MTIQRPPLLLLSDVDGTLLGGDGALPPVTRQSGWLRRIGNAMFARGVQSKV